MDTSVSTRRVIILPDEIRGGADIEFLAVMVSNEFPFIPFATVHYTENGQLTELGLRLDLDKEVFLDHFEDESKEDVLCRSAPEICAYVTPILEGKHQSLNEIISTFSDPAGYSDQKTYVLKVQTPRFIDNDKMSRALESVYYQLTVTGGMTMRPETAVKADTEEESQKIPSRT
jgi:hypothetical protein